jgi:hypothetical protein
VPKIAVQAVVGVLSHCAGVEDDDVGAVAGLGPDIAGLLQESQIRSESCAFIWQPYVRTSYVRTGWLSAVVGAVMTY